MGWKIITEPAAEPVSLSEAKLHLRVDGSTEDALITRLIAAAREELEQQLDRSVASQTLQLVLDEFPVSAITLPRGPVTSVSFVKYVAGDGTLTTIDSAAYVLDDNDPEPSVLPAYGLLWPAPRVQANAVQIQYVAGWAANVCPASLKQWILLRVGVLFENRESANVGNIVNDFTFADRIIDRWRAPGV